MSTGLEFNPGREATTEELVRLNAVAGELRRHLHEPRPQPRLRPAPGDRRVPRGRARRRHEGGDLAPERPPQHERARARLGAGGREDGGARARQGSTCSPTRRRSARGSARCPGSCRRGSPPTARRRRCARLRDPALRERLRTECDRYWRFIHKGEWHRVRLQASPQHPELDGLDFARDRRAARAGDPWDCYFDILADAGAGVRERSSWSATLFTDEHLAEMIGAPALLPRRRHVHGRRRRAAAQS